MPTVSPMHIPLPFRSGPLLFGFNPGTHSDCRLEDVFRRYDNFGEMLSASGRMPNLKGAPVAAWIIGRLAALGGTAFPYKNGQEWANDWECCQLNLMGFTQGNAVPVASLRINGGRGRCSLETSVSPPWTPDQIRDVFMAALLENPLALAPAWLHLNYHSHTDHRERRRKHPPYRIGWDGQRFINDDLANPAAQKESPAVEVKKGFIRPASKSGATRCLDRVFRRIDELKELGIEMDEATPASNAEIDALEKKLGVSLPGVLRELYLWGGQEPGLFGAMDLVSLSDQMRKDFRALARKRIKADGADSAFLDAAVIVDMGPDHFSYIYTDHGDDPAIFNYIESGPSPCGSVRYSDYLAILVEQFAGIEEALVVTAPGELSKLLERGAREMKHLLFSGEVEFAAIPNEVFAFTELRSLNLVGKGLIEISPRIGELSFLKRLQLAHNSLTSLPMALAELNELEELELTDNQLTSVIGVIRRLPALRRCALAGSGISEEEVEEIREEFPNIDIES